MKKILLGAAIACGLYSTYNLSVIAGNSTSTALVEKSSATVLVNALENLSPILYAARHTGQAEGWLAHNSKLAAEGRKAALDAAQVPEQVAYKDSKGYHYQGKLYNAEEFLSIAEAKPIRVVRQTEEIAQRAQAAHRDRTSCKDLALFVKQGLELTPAQQATVSHCNITSRVNIGKPNTAKQRTVKGYGVTVKIQGEQVYVDGHAAALDEKTPQAMVFSQGLDQITVYKSGKVHLMREGRYVGELK